MSDGEKNLLVPEWSEANEHQIKWFAFHLLWTGWRATHESKHPVKQAKVFWRQQCETFFNGPDKSTDQNPTEMTTFSVVSFQEQASTEDCWRQILLKHWQG